MLLFTACPPPAPQTDGGVDAGADAGSPWRVVLEDRPGALLSAWESADGVLYAVGGTAFGAYVLRHDADGWWQMDPGTSKALWWVHGFSANDVWAVGAAGVITHFDGTRWRVEREGGAATLFGAYGTSTTDLVAVGGVVSVSAPKPLVLRRTPSGWSEVAALPASDSRAFFKVWGRSATDTFFVGERGLIGRGLPETLTLELSGLSDRLTTVHGNASETYIVGGLQRPVMLRRFAGEWRPVTIPGTPQLLNGVAVSASGDTVIVGLNGYVAEGRAETFAQRRAVTDFGLHAVLSSRSGFVAVGGDLVDTLGRGIVLTNGSLEGGVVQQWPHPGIRFDGGIDAGVMDAGVVDAGPMDAGVVDAGLVDAGLVDAGPVDAGPVDAGSVDAGEPDAGDLDGGDADAGVRDGGFLGPGDDCGMAPNDCGPGMMCWFVFGPFRNYCAATCTDVAQCGAYGPGACCRLPGPQAMENVCLTSTVCDGGM